MIATESDDLWAQLSQAKGYTYNNYQAGGCPDRALVGDLPDPTLQLVVRQREATMGSEALTRHDPNTP